MPRRGPGSRPLPALLLAAAFAAPAAAPAGCLPCDVLFATGCNFELWRIDPVTLQSTLVGVTPEFMYDVAATADGRLFALGVSGLVWEIDPCTGAATATAAAPGNNGLAGAPAGALLYDQGPPLVLADPATGTTQILGGAIGPGPGEWCGPSSGDLAFQPGSDALYSTLACVGGGCNGDTLVRLDPATGEVTATVGCTRDATGTGFPDVHGLAFDSSGTLWGTLGSVVQPDLLHLDPATALVTTVPVTGGYVCGTGLAILPCAAAEPVCMPLTQGFWKRVCKGPHPSGEHEKLDSYAPCVAASATFPSTRDAADICVRLEPQPPSDKCEQAEAQLMASLLNVCSGRLGKDCCVDSPTTAAVTVGDALAEADGLLADPRRSFRDCVRAQAIAAGINEGSSLCQGASRLEAHRRAVTGDPGPTRPQLTPRSR